MALSYSFHLSAKSHAVNTTGKVAQCSKHNLRKYKSEHYNKNNIDILRGSRDSILDSVQEIYHREFDECLKEYNRNKRSDRQIVDYLTHVSNSRSDVAAEIIIQIGDKDFWKKNMELFGRYIPECLRKVFCSQIEKLEELCPEFKIASAVIHYDESSPHLHLIGVPVATGYKKGLKKQVAKTKVFTAERLSFLQDAMRKNMQEQMEIYYGIFSKESVKEKRKGRNKDIPKQSLDEFYSLQKRIDSLRKIEAKFLDKESDKPFALTINGEKKIFYSLPSLERQAREKADSIDSVINAYNNISKAVAKGKKPKLKIESHTVKDGFMQSHEEYIIKLPEVYSLRQAMALQKEIESLYTKYYTETSLEAVLSDYKRKGDKYVEKILKDAQEQIQSAKELLGEKESILQATKTERYNILERAERTADQLIADAQKKANDLQKEAESLYKEQSRATEEAKDIILKARLQAEDILQEAYRQSDLDTMNAILDKKLELVPLKQICKTEEKIIELQTKLIGVGLSENELAEILQKTEYRKRDEVINEKYGAGADFMAQEYWNEHQKYQKLINAPRDVKESERKLRKEHELNKLNLFKPRNKSF